MAARPAVMQVVLNLEPGGGEQLVVAIATRLGAAYRSVVCCLDGSGPLEAPLAREGIPVATLGRQPGFRPMLARRIAALADRHGAEVLHCHHYSSFVYGRLAALLRPRLRVVFTDHGRCAGRGAPALKRRIANRVLGRLPAGIYAVSSALRQDMIDEGFPASRVGVIRNGIEAGPRPAHDERLRARLELRLPNDAFVIGTAARLDPVKDLGTLLDAFASVRAAIPGARLVIIGDGPERADLERRARATSAVDDVCFAGYRADARRLFPAFDVYVNSSVYEGISLTLLEAMAAALPIVATDVGGTSEVVLDDETGVLVPPGRPEWIATELIALARSPDARAVAGDAGRSRLERHFTMDRMVADYVKAYSGICTESLLPGGLVSAAARRPAR